ncbi:hypothetical protein ACDQ55_18930 [Chitinophaga sp. 30R24]|uniref:hypothetical protein n=1 Tax=Chitinophaga sp. 30R24 TaxID=3248838 RepID=UPI003B9141C0
MKVARIKIILLFFYLFFMACKDSSFNGIAVAKKYCKCMEDNNAHADYYNARIICDSKFALENRYFRINYIEALYGNGYMGTLQKKTVDSVNEFNYRFYMYVSDHSPYIYNADSIRKDYLKRMK